MRSLLIYREMTRYDRSRFLTGATEKDKVYYCKIELRMTTKDPQVEAVIISEEFPAIYNDKESFEQSIENGQYEIQWDSEEYFMRHVQTNEQIKDEEAELSYREGEINIMDLTLDISKLPFFGFYEDHDIKVLLKKDKYATDEMVSNIKKAAGFKAACLIVYGEANEIYEDVIENRNKRLKKGRNTKRFCSNCGHKFIDDGKQQRCPNCNALFRCEKFIADKNMVDHYFKIFGKEKPRYRWGWMKPPTINKAKQKYRYIDVTDSSFKVSVVQCETSVENGVVTENWTVPYELVHEVGGNMKAYKNLATKQKEVDAYEALMLRQENQKPYDFINVYNNYDNFMQMMLDNEIILKKCGFIDVLKFTSHAYNIEKFFYDFLAVMNQFPSLEQIVKGGYIQLFWKAYDCVSSGMKLDSVKNGLKKFSVLINNEGTTSKDAMRLPYYIVEYLSQKDANVNEYVVWMDIQELTGISKEQFEEIINSFAFICISSNASMETLANIIKYGYPIKKLMNYIVKKAQDFNGNINSVVNTLRDYLSMCETISVEPDMYPMDLKKQHDDIVDIFKDKQMEAYNDRIMHVRAQCVPVFDAIFKAADRPVAMDDYCVVIPSCSRDFLEEGNRQHNCVAGYAQKVANGQCIVYFLRKKLTPDESFITAEYKRDGCGWQFLLSNNRVVSDPDLLIIRDYINKKLKDAVDKGKIVFCEEIKKI